METVVPMCLTMETSNGFKLDTLLGFCSKSVPELLVLKLLVGVYTVRNEGLGCSNLVYKMLVSKKQMIEWSINYVVLLRGVDLDPN